jgi:hypothetical protein
MNTKTLLGIGGVAILAYYLFRNKKKVEVSDLQKEPANVIPSVVKNSPLLPLCAGKRIFRAFCAVVAPVPWFANAETPTMLIPSNWTQINRS